jgi:hypothetical protein
MSGRRWHRSLDLREVKHNTSDVRRIKIPKTKREYYTDVIARDEKGSFKP